MGLTYKSTGKKASESLTDIKKNDDEYMIALAGNPNVGKSTVFNNLTGMNQHTGNWPGKTVSNARGICKYNGKHYVMIDLPGTYSLTAHSAEEEVARDFICFGSPDAVAIICDATCLERNLNLVLQTMEITDNVIVCVNMMDEAGRKKIRVDTEELSKRLGVFVTGIVARKKGTLDKLMNNLSVLVDGEKSGNIYSVRYPEVIEEAVDILKPTVAEKLKDINPGWLSLKLLEYDESLIDSINNAFGFDILSDQDISQKLREANTYLNENGISKENLRDIIVSSIVRQTEEICKGAVIYEDNNYSERDRKIDRFLTGKLLGYPLMILLLILVFWVTIKGANYPSMLLSDFFFYIEGKLTGLFEYFKAPGWLHGILISGVYRVLAWVVAVMLPPMAIFFPLFTLLEDLGYLPRVAFNLDKYFKKCSSCGKQALTMCMGFGCNAAGVVGCRIIDSPRERLIAVITNNFVPCNGRFPTLIAILTMFFTGFATGIFGSLFSSVLLTAVILLGIAMTFAVSKLLSKTILKGVPSSFTLELPPYRKPQFLKVLVRSIFDRTLFVLGRAAAVAAPAGAVIWILANIEAGGDTLLNRCADFLDPFAGLLGLDGVILLAFILGFPANEIVVPIIIMIYMAEGSLAEMDSLAELKQLLVSHDWTWITAVSAMLFSLMHWPCSTTCITIRKETRSIKWTLASILIPTLTGIVVCFIFANTARLITGI